MKNAVISGVVGLIFMVGGFFAGMRLVHLPTPPKTPAATAVAAATASPPKPAFSVESLRKTTQSLLEINQALQAREAAVALREKKALELETELTAERAALDRAHQQFHTLYQEFLSRLQLVKSSEIGQEQRQIEIYSSMDSAQVVDLLRAQDDGTVTRLFSLMEPKPLAKLVTAWKAKFPTDSPRLLAALNGMSKVQPADQMALKDNASPSASDANPAGSTNAAATPSASSGESTPPSLSENSTASPQVPAAKTN